MRERWLALITAAAMTLSTFTMPTLSVSAESTTNSTGTARQMEYLNRGLVAVKVSDGVYLSWRLLGTESLENQAFDIYRDGKLIHRTGVHDATCFTDTEGTSENTYIVVPANTVTDGETAVTPWTTNQTNSAQEYNSIAYMDVEFAEAPPAGVTPDDGKEYTYKDSDGNIQTGIIDGNYTYSPNDMSVGDLDGDGDYELVVKWLPSNARDNSNTGYTGEVYFDAYELDGTFLWRMCLGPNIRAGAHYNQYIVYDFDGDGKAELAVKTAPGSKDAQGNYVSAVGKDIGEVDDTANYVSTAGTILEGPEYLTIFEGETGKALQTVLYDPPRSIHDVKDKNAWGDNYGNRCERYLAGVAYLNGKTPSLIMTRGYYTYAYAAAYNWDGENLTLQWLSSNYPTAENGGTGCTVKYADGTTKNDPTKTLYGQGAHSLSVADIDNDGCDEVIFGAAFLDNDGMAMYYDGRGHGDAEHVSDFDNDGRQEIFMVHEHGKSDGSMTDFAIDIKRADGDVLLQPAAGDVGRGNMANIDDAYAQESGDLAIFWSSNVDGVYNQKSEQVGGKPGFINFLVYWDGDLGRELLDDNKLAKYRVNGGMSRFFFNKKTSYLTATSCNGSKATPCLSADIFGDWREEIILYTSTGVRIFFSTIPTEYRLTTLMHDSQYRCAVAWQNVGYNQPPHQSYYIGSAALAKDEEGNTLNYLAPAVEFNKIKYPDSVVLTPRPTLEPTPEVVTLSVYDKGGSEDTAWAETDLNDWTQTGSATFEYGVDETNTPNGYITCYKTNPSSSYSMSKKFDIRDDATYVNYDVVWKYGGVISNGVADTYANDNAQFLQFGEDIRLAWVGASNHYGLLYSTDGGATYTAIHTNKADYTSKISVVYDVVNKKLEALSVDGKKILTDIQTDLIDSLSFGVHKGTVGWYNKQTAPRGILTQVTVTQKYEIPVSTAGPTESPTTAPTTAPTPAPTPEPTAEILQLAVEADTYLVYNDTETVHGADEGLKINMATDMYSNATPGLKEAKGLGFLRFNLSDYSQREIVSAKLVMYYKTTNGDAKSANLHLDYCSKDDWNEDTFTAKDITIRGKGTPLSSTGLVEYLSVSTDSYAEITYDVTDVLKADDDNIYTFTLWTETGREQTIASKEYTGNDAKAPMLVIEFEKDVVPTAKPTVTPTASPTAKPTVTPTASPTAKPTVTPTASPTAKPTVAPTASPTVKPTVAPTASPTAKPTVTPTASPTLKPTVKPTVTPTASPTVKPTVTPIPSVTPTPSVTPLPIITPAPSPTAEPISRIDAEITESEGKLNCVVKPVKCGAGKVITALYKDNVLVGIKVSEYNGTDELNIDVEYQSEPDAVKIVLWDNFDKMQAICTPFTALKSNNWK